MSTLHPSPLHRLSPPRPVDRYEYIRQRVAGRRVLDLGAYDETEIVRRQHGSWRWLHAIIAGSAKETLGIDAAPALAATGSITTPVGTTILYGTVDDLAQVVRDFQPDLIVGGELIEHTPDTLGWLSRLAGQTPGTEIVLTTPNPTSVINLILAFLNRENQHPDHLHNYTYRTLHTLMSRVPLHDMRILPYRYEPHLFYSRVPRPVAPLVTATDRLVMRPTQWMWPMTSFGWIVDGVLGPAQNRDVSSTTTPEAPV